MSDNTKTPLNAAETAELAAELAASPGLYGDSIHRLMLTCQLLQGALQLSENARVGHAGLIKRMTEELKAGNASDGHHTHNELYEHRMWLTIYAIEAWKWWDGFEAVKSRKHADGELCFDGGWFIVMVKLPAGWISYHYEDQYWDLFTISQAEVAPEYDGHTADDVVDRMRQSMGQLKLASVGQRLARHRFVELEERIKTLTQDVSWTLSELGHDHWQNCETTAEDCYQCAGYLALKEKYKDA